MNMAPSRWKYGMGPFLLEAPFPIPELKEISAEQPTNVRFDFGDVPRCLEGALAEGERWSATKSQYVLHVEEVASYWVKDGCSVTIQLVSHSLMSDVRAYLLSPIFATLCHQSGRFALHASAIQMGQQVVAFIGHSGAGKSTLVACFARKGYNVISDDICLVDDVPLSEPSVVPVAPSIKLWKQTLDLLGEGLKDHPRVYSKYDKYRLPAAEVTDRLPLRHVLFLEWDGVATVPAIRPLDKVTALAKMMDFTHQAYLVKASGRRRENFELWGKVLTRGDASELIRPRDIGQLDQVVTIVEEYFANR
jgi:energy-coupling factor transporter ATP-binding protein EcfA2